LTYDALLAGHFNDIPMAVRGKGFSRREAKNMSQKIIDEWRSKFCISMKEHAMNVRKSNN
jgi:hypothetical protein